ncbi:MAG: patatin-like phospholipase family protein [Hyphomicrobiaceae bacterium]
MTKTLAPTSSLPVARPPRIGLALGGGGARGLAHVVALEVFDELGLKPSAIAGTSIGAVYGAGYASGLSGKALRAITEDTLSGRLALVRQLFAARSQPSQKLFRVLPVRSALLSSAAVVDLILPPQVPSTFDALPMPLRLTATDLATHQGITLESGDLRSAVAASIAIPVVFAPVHREGRVLLDGGLVNPCPYDLLEGLCDVVVAIDVSGASAEASIGPNPTAVEVMVQSMQILQKSITRERMRFSAPDVYIEVGVDRFGALEFYKPREILEAAETIRGPLRARLKRVLGSETVQAIQP